MYEIGGKFGRLFDGYSNTGGGGRTYGRGVRKLLCVMTYLCVRGRIVVFEAVLVTTCNTLSDEGCFAVYARRPAAKTVTVYADGLYSLVSASSLHSSRAHTSARQDQVSRCCLRRVGSRNPTAS
jgi:hypothetical protein